MSAGQFLIQRRDRNIDSTVIESDGLTIGRLPGNELILNHRAVDDTLAGLKEIDGRYFIFNLSSSNGIVVNRRLVERAELRTGDVMQAGPYLLNFEVGDGVLTIVVEVGAGWQVEEAGSDAAVHRPSTESIEDVTTLDVFWDKRKRESGRITDENILTPRGKRRLGKGLTCWRPTLDLRQPWRAGWFIWGSLAVSLFGLSALAAWHGAYSPGPLASPHTARTLASHDIANRPADGKCSSCHSPLQSMQSQCLGCHQVASFAETISDAHRKAGLDCSSCHKEHRGGDAASGLVNDAVCQDCHTNRAPMHQGSRAGTVLGLPHPATKGYPVIAGVWRWKGLSAAAWKAEQQPAATASAPAQEQFHTFHASVKMNPDSQAPMDCTACHGDAAPEKATKPLALLQACNSCHASTGELAGSRIGCVSCHPSHGSTRDVRMALAGNGAFNIAPHSPPHATAPLRPAASPSPRIGGLSWPLWTGVLFLPLIFSLIALSTRSAKLRALIAAVEDAPATPEQETLRDGGPGYAHPVIDPELCIGCHACVNACPHDVLAMVNGIATPVALDQCMEDTACMAECPTSPRACVVVNTTKKIPPRKVPKRNQTFMTDVPGIYLIGDVSGVPLVKNALNEGTQVMESIVDDLRAGQTAEDIQFDVGIIGIGPAGFSAAVSARDSGLKYLALEAGRLANTIRSYPAGKYVFLKPETVAVKGTVPLPGVGIKREDLLSAWDALARDVNIRETERCSAIKVIPGGFEIATRGEAGQGEAVYTARRVVIAIGNLGSPMKLRVPGEEMTVPLGSQGRLVDKVRYSLSDPDDYVGRRCIVVGAGNSAIEAAVELTGFRREGDGFSFTRTNKVTLVVRSDFKGDLKLGNKMNIYDCMDAGAIQVFFRTTIKEISESQVILTDARSGEEKARIENDFIFALIGSERATDFLNSMGIKTQGA